MQKAELSGSVSTNSVCDRAIDIRSPSYTCLLCAITLGKGDNWILILPQGARTNNT